MMFMPVCMAKIFLIHCQVVMGVVRIGMVMGVGVAEGFVSMGMGVRFPKEEEY